MSSDDKHTIPPKILDLQSLPEDLQEIWDASEEARPKAQVPDELETEDALKKVLLQIDTQESKSTTRKRPFYIYAAAASVLIAALTAGFLFNSVDIVAPIGQTQLISLSDGSTVELNSNSTLTYRPRVYGIFSRNVSLDGEAYFDIARSTTPFAVTTQHTVVEVLGTEFTVSDWKDSRYNNSEVAVYEGKVQVTAFSESAHILELGDAISIDSQTKTITKNEVDPTLPTSWKGIGSSESDLTSLFERLALLNDIEIRFDEEYFSKEKITAYYSSEKSISDILNDLSIVKGFEVSKTKDGFSITK
ncbi:MAG: hypothetical protein ED557_13210 [Balneola sp.]|nr:MAG: hypothetical protein ED557_13210 [Balneola sp.]